MSSAIVDKLANNFILKIPINSSRNNTDMFTTLNDENISFKELKLGKYREFMIAKERALGWEGKRAGSKNRNRPKIGLRGLRDTGAAKYNQNIFSTQIFFLLCTQYWGNRNNRSQQL